ncbi:MAG: FG-GAP-like repeat-containing protein, partial [Candidatus Thorarchaeota archaeon]
DRIQAYDPDGTFLYNWGTSGTGPNQFDFPFGIAYDSSGLLYITDTYTHRVLIYDTNGNYVDEWVASNGWLYNIEVDHDGNLYVSNFPYRVDKYRPDGILLERLIQSLGTPEKSTAVSFPLGLAIDMDGSLYVTDYVEHTVAKVNPHFVPSNVSYAIVDWGEHEEIGGDATDTWDIRIWFPSEAPNVEKVDLSLSPDLEEWVTVPVEDRTFRIAFTYGSVIEYNIDNALRSMDWDKIRYMNIQVKGAEYHIDGADGRISKTIESAYVVRTGFINDTEPGDDIREILIGMADGSILAFNAETGELVWDSEGDKPRFSLDAGIRDIVQLDGRGIMPTFEYYGIQVTPATFSGITVTQFHGYSLGHIDNTAAKDMVVTAAVSGVSRLLYLRNTGTDENPIWLYIPNFFPTFCPDIISEAVGFFASPTLADIDQDGDVDLILVTGSQDVDTGAHSSQIKYYEQIASNNWVERTGYFTSPQLVADTAELLPKMSFYDMDGNGDLDLTMANDSLFYFGGGGPTTPFAWGRLDSYYQGINDQIRGIDSIDKVAFSDWDKDGDVDVTLAFSYTNYSDWILAPENATLAYFENTGTPGNPVWVKRRSMYEPDFRGSPISPSLGYIEPSFIDMNGDGVEDFIGLQDTYIRSYRGTITHDSFIVATYPYIHLVEVEKRGMDDGFYGYEAYDSWSNEKKYQNWTYAIEFADTDRDGKDEVIVGSFDNNVYTFEQVANNTYRRAWRSPDLAYTYDISFNEVTLWEDVRDIVVGDQDQDGKLEIIAASGWRIVVFENVEDNLYQLVWQSGNQIPNVMGVSLWVSRDRSRVTELALGSDLDRDGLREIVAASHDWVFIFENTDNDTYSMVWQWQHLPHLARFIPEIYDLHVADADRDGFMEIIVVGTDERRDPWGEVYNAQGWFYIWENSEDADGNPVDNAFDEAIDQILSVQGVGAYSVDVADHDRNMKDELILGIGSGVNIWLNTGNNLYQEIALLPTEDPVSNVLSANTDGDSFYEIVVSQGRRVSVFEQNWTHPLEDHYYDNVWNSTKHPTDVTDIVIGDSNHNGLLEILVTAAEGYVYSYEWVSNGTLEEGGAIALASLSATGIPNDSSQGGRDYIENLSAVVLMERIRTPAKVVRWLEEV